MCRSTTSKTTLRIAMLACVAGAGLLFGGTTTAQARQLGPPATATPSSALPELPPTVSKATCVIDPNGECIVPSAAVSASPPQIQAGGQATVTWVCSNSSSAEAFGSWSGSLGVSGSATLTLSTVGTYTFIVRCYGQGTYNDGAAQVTVTSSPPPPPPGPPQVWLSVNPTFINDGQPVRVSWGSTNNPDYCSGNFTSPIPAGGFVDLWPHETVTYALQCANAAGSGNVAYATVVVTRPPLVGLTASPSAITDGQSATLNWSSTNGPTSCWGNFGSSLAANGSFTVSPHTTTTYSFQCSNDAGYSNVAYSTVTVVYPQPTVTASASPSAVPYGSYTTVNWTSANADSCKVGSTTVGTSGPYRLEPILGASNVPVTCVGKGGTATAYVAVTNDATPIVARGTLKDANGGPVLGNVRLFVHPDLSNTGDSGTETQVASVLSDGNGNWGVALDPNDATVRNATINGWLNLGVTASSSLYEGLSAIQRRWAGGNWTDALEGMPTTAPTPLSLALADGQPGVRTIASVDSVTSAGVWLPAEGIAYTQVVNTIVGEFHDVQDETGSFEYRETGATSYDKGFSYDLTHWGISGSEHMSKSSVALTGSGGSKQFGAGKGVLMLVPIKWALVKVQPNCFLCSQPKPVHYEWRAVGAAGGVVVGASISSLDHHCDDYYGSHTLYRDPHAPFDRHSGRSYKYSEGVSLSFGGATVKLGTQTGYDQNHGWTVTPGGKYPAYTYCGNDDYPALSSRVFWG